MIVRNFKTLILTHRSRYLFRSGGKNTFLCMGERGQVTIFNKNAQILDSINLEDDLHSVDFSHSSGLMVGVCKQALAVFDYRRRLIFQKKGNYSDIFMQSDLLWASLKHDEELSIEVFDTDTWELIDCKKIPEAGETILMEGYNQKNCLMKLSRVIV